MKRPPLPCASAMWESIAPSSAHREQQRVARVSASGTQRRSWCCCRRRRLDDLSEGDGGIVRWQRHGQMHAEAGLLEKRLCRIREAPVLEDSAAQAHREVAAPERVRAPRSGGSCARAHRGNGRRAPPRCASRRRAHRGAAPNPLAAGRPGRRSGADLAPRRRCRDGLELHRALCLVTRVRRRRARALPQRRTVVPTAVDHGALRWFAHARRNRSDSGGNSPRLASDLPAERSRSAPGLARHAIAARQPERAETGDARPVTGRRRRTSRRPRACRPHRGQRRPR